MHLKVDDEVVFLYVVLIFCALAGFRRANASGACRIIQRGGHFQGEAVARRL